MSAPPKLSDDGLTMTIDATAKTLADTAALIHCSDPAGRASMAHALTALLAYRADRERRERVACPSIGSSLPVWCIVGQRVYHAGKTGEIIACEENPSRITIRYPDADVVMPARDLGYVMPVDADGRALFGAKAVRA